MLVRPAATALRLAFAATFPIAGVTTAPSDLESSVPAGGAVVGRLSEIAADFSEEMGPAPSSMGLRGPDGTRIARGGVPEGGPPTRMAIAALAIVLVGGGTWLLRRSR